MILVTGTATVDPDHREQAIELAKTLAEHSRKEFGCVEYRITKDLEDENTFYFFELWDSLADLDDHFETEHTATFQAEIEPLLDGDLETTTYEVAGEPAYF